MHSFFEVTASDIEQLNDEQARELVARLCKAELRQKAVATSHVTWGGDQRAKDGGVDVRVDIFPKIGISGYVPRDETAYQVKAESFAPAKIAGEMAPNNDLRPAIEQLRRSSGAYVIVSTRDNCSDTSLTNRKTAMLKCLTKHGLIGNIHLDFYDSRRIADWAGNYPGVLVWLRAVLGKPIQGWKPYGPWAYHENSVEDEYLLDDKAKVFIPNTDEPISVIDAIQRLREKLVENGASVRIVGMSGVGKTRLVRALFDSHVATSAATLSQENVLYTDLSDNADPQPTAIFEALIQEGADCVVVIDNCGQGIHSNLTEIVQRPESKIRVVTVEYDIRDDLPAGTACFRLEGSSAEVVAKLLKRRFCALSDLDIRKIVEFSDGNARVAFALASTSETKDQLAQLRDDELFRRLFVQKHTESNELQRCAEAASLLYSFDVEDVSEDSELAILSSIAEVTIQTFYRNIAELQNRGLVQGRGKWRAVLPHAISNRLACSAFQCNPLKLLVQKCVTESSERVARSFSRRLGYLHESRHAQEIVGEWLRPDGRLGDLSQLSNVEWEMLENVAPVNRQAALHAILRAIEKVDFLSLTNVHRSHSARLLRSLAYETDLFVDSATALLKFALEEPEGYKGDSIREILQSLFYAHLSGTLATPEQRAVFVRTLAFSGDEKKNRLAIILLRAGIETHHFPSHFDFEFGALKRSYGWYPRFPKEVQEWYGLFICLAVDLGKSSTSLGVDARSLLGDAFRELWCDAQMYEALTDAAHELATVDGWPRGWVGIRNALHWDKDRLDAGSLGALQMLEKELSPRDLLTKIRAKVLSQGSIGVDLDDDFEPDAATDSYAKAYEGAKALGKAATQDAESLADLAPFISNANITNMLWYFGVGVGSAAVSVQAILERLRPLIEQLPANNIDLQFICGLIDGWNQANPEDASAFLDSAITDDVWGALFPSLQLSIEINDAAYCRLIKSLGHGKASCFRYANLGCGRRTDSLTVTQISGLLSLLATQPEGGLPGAIDILHMVIHCTDRKSAEYKSELRIFCLRFVGEINWGSIDLINANLVYHLVQIVKFALAGIESYDSAAKVVNRLIHLERSGNRHFCRRLGSIFLPFFTKFPIETLDAVYNREEQTALIRMLTVSLDRHDETAIRAIPEVALIDWCKHSPSDRCIFAARTCRLFDKQEPEDESGEELIGISSIAINLVALACDKKTVLETLVERCRKHWPGSRAAIMRQRFRLLDQFNPTGDAEITALIDEMKVRLEKIIENEEQQEQIRERFQTASFE